MTATSHVIDGNDGAATATVNAHQHPSGLLTYEIPDNWDGDTPYVWRVGHHSGLCIAVARTPDAATKAADILADVTDWTASADGLRAPLPDGPPQEVWQQLADIDVVKPRYR